jgi:hypothetical protein
MRPQSGSCSAKTHCTLVERVLSNKCDAKENTIASLMDERIGSLQDQRATIIDAVDFLMRGF